MRSPIPAFADASLFMGMHSRQDEVRIACKNFFVERLGLHLVMTLDQVGLCDDIVWRQSRSVQDLYYPFMDQLHTLLAAERVAYTRSDIQRAGEDPQIKTLDGLRALLVARVRNEHGLLYTADPVLLDRPHLPVRSVSQASEKSFPEPIETAYRASLALRLDPALLAVEE